MSSETITRNDLTNILNEIIPSLMVDFVIEEGTDNGWTYKKYNSGAFDAWRSFDLNVACSSASGSLYCSADQSLSLPSFTNTNINDWAISGAINGLESIWFLTFTASPPSIVYRLMRTTSRTAANRHVNMTLHGKWK